MNASSNIASLNEILPWYQQASGKSAQEILSKQAGKLAFNLKTDLRKVSPTKGKIREELLGRLAGGQGFKIRPSVVAEVFSKYGKANIAPKRGPKTKAGQRLNRAQELVRREIALREGGRGVLSVSVRYPRTVETGQKAVSRFGPAFSEATVQPNGPIKFARFLWSGVSRQSKRVVEGLQSAKGQAVLAQAINETRADTLEYVTRKAKQVALQTVRRMHK